MAKNKFYAVIRGVIPGIYESWDECEKNVKGFPDALYKGFSTRAAAEQFQHDDIDNQVEKKEEKVLKVDYDEMVNCKLNEGRVVAFTDGGFNSKNKIAGYGVYILEPDGKKHEISDIVRTERFQKSNNITPEVMAVISALDWAISNNYGNITIFHDYKGIGKWGNEEWDAKSDISSWFVDKLKKDYLDILNIEYVWVPGHSGVYYNEQADKLATEAINKNTKPQFKMSESYFKCQNVGEKDVLGIIKQMQKIPDIVIDSRQDSTKYVFQLKYRKEKLTISYYMKNTNTLVQGKPNYLFSLFVSYYTEKIPDYNLVKAYSDMYKKKIQLSDIELMTSKLNLPKDFPEDATKLVKQSFVEKIALSEKKYNHAYDYSHYIFPACRALEGMIKYLFEIEGIHIRKDGTIGSYFEKDDDDLFFLNGRRYETIKYKEKLENAYNVYYRNRHAIGHFGELLSTIDGTTTTRIVESQDEAINIIEEIHEAIKFD